MFNPLNYFIRSKQYKLSHFVSSTFSQKMKDTYRFFFGFSLDTDLDKEDLGILDFIYPLPVALAMICLFLLAPLFSILASLFSYLLNKLNLSAPVENRLNRIADTLNYIIIAPFWLVIQIAIFSKFLISILFTAFASSFVALSHMVANRYVQKSSKNIFSINIEIDDHTPKNSRHIIFHANRKIQLHVEFSNETIKTLEIKPYTMRTYPDKNTCLEKPCLGLYNSKKDLVGIIQINSENLNAIEKILKINKFNATYNLLIGYDFKKTKELNLIEEKITQEHIKTTLYRGLLKNPNNTSSLKTFANSPYFDRNIINLIFFYSGHANQKQTLFARNFRSQNLLIDTIKSTKRVTTENIGIKAGAAQRTSFANG